MKLTRIVEQVKGKGRYSIFVDEAYAFSLSEQALLQSNLAPGTELTVGELHAWKQRSADDKVYVQALRYAAMRLRSVWEVKMYLERKQASPPLVNKILNKLSEIHLLDDDTYAKTFIENRRLLRPSSKLKLQQELRAKHVNDAAINEALENERCDERAALRATIVKKQTLTRFKADPQKLMQYLARQGFGYEDIKMALRTSDDE